MLLAKGSGTSTFWRISVRIDRASLHSEEATTNSLLASFRSQTNGRNSARPCLLLRALLNRRAIGMELEWSCCFEFGLGAENRRAIR